MLVVTLGQHEQQVATMCCFDCGLPYGDEGWLDTKIPDEVWPKIAPNGDAGGVLCITCIASRLVRAGISNVPLLITSGPFRREQGEG